MDLSYKPGTIANCNNPLCCMNTTEMADDQNNAAGFWGSFTCDLPQWTFEEMLWHIQETHGDVCNFKTISLLPKYLLLGRILVLLCYELGLRNQLKNRFLRKFE